MNKIRLLAVLFSMLLFAGCTSDNEDSKIVGNWSLFQYILDCPIGDPSFDIKAKDGCYTNDDTETCFSFNFRQDGIGSLTISTNGVTDVLEITYTITDRDITICDLSNDCNIFQLEGDKLTIEDRDDGCIEQHVFAKS